MSETHDLFVCHASEDKDSFVRPLCLSLSNLNYRVWYDEFSLKLGDSLRRSIDNGLKKSRFGVVVLSHAFFGKNWSNYELDALVARENDSGQKVILPVWYGVTKKDVLAYSASLADRVSGDASKGIDYIVKNIADVLLEPVKFLNSNSSISKPLDVKGLTLSLYAALPSERALAARSLGEMGDRAIAAIDDLRSRLKDSSGPVRDSAKWALLKIDPDGEHNSLQRPSIEKELREFQNKFDNTTLDNYYDAILSGEDLLVSVVGQRRYDGYHSQIAYLLSEIVSMHEAKATGNDGDFAKHERSANSWLDALKKRIAGIRVREPE